MSAPAIALFGTRANDLGESPVWDDRRGWLWWVDIRHNRVLAADASGVLQRDWVFDRPVGSLGLARDGLVAAFADGFSLIDAGGGECRLARPAIGEGAIRFNDGKTDRQGRFLAGTMQHGGQAAALAALWRLDGNGDVAQLAGGMRLVNAICFSPCGAWLYFADSLDGMIRRCAYDTGTGTPGAREDFFDCAALGLVPDGATVDRQGRLWVAMVLSQQLGCISADGTLLDLIDLPVPYPSCPAFGGRDMATLFVTTIADSGHKLKTGHPDAGRMLAVTGLDASGIPETSFAT